MKYTKSGAATSGDILVTNLEDSNVSTNRLTRIWFEWDALTEKIANAGTNTLDQESFMNNGDNLNNVFYCRS